MSYVLFETGTDYDVELLRLLYRLPGGQGRSADVCRLFEKEYSHRIPEEHRGVYSNGKPIWDKNVRWGRQHLKDLGLVDAPAYGIWRITEAGRRWVEENPGATRITGVKRTRQSRSGKRTSSRKASVPGITLEMLEQTRRAMPDDQFRQLWGAVYEQLLAEKRAKAITEITQTELGRRTRRWLDEVHAFLRGKNTSTPSSEVLCEWIHFCYTLELHREAAALLSYVREEEVSPAIYKRAKRVAAVCRSRRTAKGRN